MKQIWYLSVLLIGVSTSPLGNDVDPKDLILREHESDEDTRVSGDAIVGGKYFNIEGTPYLAQLYFTGFPICGASIISPRWLITAAHCLEKVNKDFLSILTGATIQGQGQLYDVVEAISHENYNPDTVDNDIALIKIANPIEFNEKQGPIKIATKYPNPSDVMQITGFGREGNGLKPSLILKTTFVPVIGQKKCRNAYKNEEVDITTNMFCASAPGTDSCEGDSGGPAAINGKLVGIVSWGFECASLQHPGVYTKLLNYRDWVKNITGV